MLGQADRADRVEVGLHHVAVVEVTHLGEVTEPLAVDRLLRPGRLLPREGHAEGPDAVLPCGVADHPAPAAADVEQALPGLQVELAGDQVVLLELGLLERRLGLGVDGAGVGHRGPEHVLVELVGHVVVVGDHRGVAAHRVPQALHRAPPARQRLPGRGRRWPEAAQAEAADDLQRLRRGGSPEATACSAAGPARRRGPRGARRAERGPRTRRRAPCRGRRERSSGRPGRAG